MKTIRAVLKNIGQVIARSLLHRVRMYTSFYKWMQLQTLDAKTVAGVAMPILSGMPRNMGLNAEKIVPKCVHFLLCDEKANALGPPPSSNGEQHGAHGGYAA
ncbi:hypothetical protein [Sphingobium phenoxybenzoativorans]|uniref:hypothetical protein n=1 Tax=Sphingobium phenoxybenzoativorans TaxID=1592790 RepID=UPI001112D556|nr:hypothetical protein [Sphingobium phenoxybenzoativorans]